MLDLPRVKAFLRFEEGEDRGDDAVIEALLAASIAMIEAATGHLLSVREVTEGVSLRRQREAGGIRLFKAPVNAVTAVTYLDGGSDPETNTVAVDAWQLVEGSEARLLPGWGAAWPTLDAGQVLTVTYSAGYADDAIPAALEQAAVSLAAHFYHHRDDMASIPPGIDAMISPFRPLGIA